MAQDMLGALVVRKQKPQETALVPVASAPIAETSDTSSDQVFFYLLAGAAAAYAGVLVAQRLSVGSRDLEVSDSELEEFSLVEPSGDDPDEDVFLRGYGLELI